MPTHLDPAFLEPTAPAPIERDTETGDLFAPPAEPSEQTNDAPRELPTQLRLMSAHRRGGRPEHIRTIVRRVLRALSEGRAA